MSRYLGRIVGLAIGALGGPVGAVFGVLTGWLVDQFRASAGTTWRFDRFLARPEAERNGQFLSLYVTASVLSRVLLVDGPPRRVQVERALAIDWPEFRQDRRRRAMGSDLPQRKALIDRCLTSATPVDVTRVIAPVRAGSLEARQALLDLVVAVACADPRGMSDEERGLTVSIAQALDLKFSQVRDGEARWGGLNREACRILGVPDTADAEEVRRTFRHLAAQMHPDTGGVLDETQQQSMRDAFVRIRDAHDHLIEQLRGRNDLV